MLSERDYLRDSGGSSQKSVTTWITILQVVVFALQCVNEVYLKTPAEGWLALTRHGLLHGWIWQLFTFQFLHADLSHLIFNLMLFWWLGHFCEGLLGTRRYLIALFGSGAFGGVLQGILMLFLPQYYGDSVVGASAGVSALLAIFALCERDSEVLLGFFLPVRSIWLLWISLAISLFFTLVPSPREFGVAHAAHLGGLLAGMLWIRMGWHHDFKPLPGSGWVKWFQNRGKSKKTVRGQGSDRWKKLEWDATPSAPRKPKVEDISQEIDPILDKMNAHGPQSLTEREREILAQAGRRLRK